jgi:citrate synthase
MGTKNTLSITDNRTGKTYEVPVNDGTIRALDLRQIKMGDGDFGLMSYDPAFQNTASCRSAISFIDGERGILTYRGYAIQELAEKSSFLETAYLLLEGWLPKRSEYEGWVNEIKAHTFLHENIVRFMWGFRYDAHPMNVLIATVAALASFHPEAKEIHDHAQRRAHIVRLIAKIPTIAAWAFRHNRGYPYVYPDEDLSYTGNFLSMIKRMTERHYKPHPVLERALDVLFVLHADHEQNCSTHTARGVGSSRIDPYSCAAAAAAALYGPLHGGANEAVLDMLRRIGSVEAVPAFVKSVKGGAEGGKLMGFGHRVYKSYDPRATVIKKLADEVFDATGKNPLLNIALELERIVLEDEYFVSRKLYPNVDFYSGLIYEAMGFPADMFTVLFAIPRVAGWMAQWNEAVEDKEQKIARPRQVYTGHETRAYATIAER